MDLAELTKWYEELPILDISDLKVGDLLFCSDNGRMQRMFNLVGDKWVHVALVIEVEGELRSAEVGMPDHVVSRPIEAVIASYNRVGVGRPGIAQACVDAAVTDATQAVRERTDSIYAWDDFMLAGVSLLSRRLLPVSSLGRLAAAFAEISETCSTYHPSSRTCSSFVHDCFSDQGQGCVISVDITNVAARALTIESSTSAPTLADFTALPDRDQQAVLDEFSLLQLVQQEWMNKPTSETDAAANPEWMDEPTSEVVAAWMDESPAPNSGDAGGVVEPAWLQVRDWGPEEREQLANSVATTARLIDALMRPGTPNVEAPPLDGRWVSPADLWRSDQIHFRARLTSEG